jgi:hypothetical protein
MADTRDELWRHLDWSFWGTGMADVFREPLAATMLAAITPEQREQANALITRWRDHREFVGRDKYEAQKAEIDQLRELVRDLADPDPCTHFDHHGYCQTHGWFAVEPPCPHGRARQAGLVHADDEES